MKWWFRQVTLLGMNPRPEYVCNMPIWYSYPCHKVVGRRASPGRGANSGRNGFLWLWQQSQVQVSPGKIAWEEVLERTDRTQSWALIMKVASLHTGQNHKLWWLLCVLLGRGPCLGFRILHCWLKGCNSQFVDGMLPLSFHWLQFWFKLCVASIGV